MNYNEIENKYIKAQIKGHYKFETAAEIKEVLGHTISKMRGFKALSDEDKQTVERLICNFYNGFGLQAREDMKPTKIKKDLKRSCFTFYYNNSEDQERYSYLFFNGSIG